jgi:hypothetical protein
MVSNVTSTTFSQTYRDDFADSDHYHRILFNNGRALQARELTQLQTIIQKEAERHARFVFNDGASVQSGGVQLDNKYEFVKLNTTSYSLPSSYTSLVGETFVGLTSTINVRIVEIVPAVGLDPATVYVEYINNNQIDGTDTPTRLIPGEIINGLTSGANLQVQTTNTTINPAVGRGIRLSVKSSTFFVLGHFVTTDSQSIILSKYSNEPTVNAGFVVTEDVVTSSDNNKLYDNSTDTPNLTAPGADRYRIRLTLELEDNVDSDTTFLKAYSIVKGSLVSTAAPGPNSLNVIMKIMEKRTADESGSYTVKPFLVKTLENDSDNTKLDIQISAGSAYVEGHYAELESSIRIPIDKPRTTETVNNDVIAANYGNYVICSTLRGLPQINTLATVDLRSAVTYGGSTIGTARIRSVEEFGSYYRVYLFDVTMSGSNNFSAVRSIGTSVTNYVDLVLENGVAVIKDTTNNNLLFDLRYTRPAALSDISLATQRRFTGTTTGSGTIQFNLSATGETFANSSNWIATVDSSGLAQNIAITSGGNGTASVTLGSLPTSSAITMIAIVNKGASTVKTKTLTNVKTTFTPAVDNTITLAKADGYRVNEIRNGSATGNIITNQYIFDNGQKDNFYDVAKLYLRSGYSAPAGNVYVDFDYFEHGANGDFFAVNSYTGQVNYEDIPIFRQKNAQIVQLRDVLDFRSRKDNTGANFTGTGAIRMEIPVNTDLITADVSYYRGKYYRIALGNDGGFRAIGGDDALFPQFPTLPENNMELYKLKVNPYVLDQDDVALQYVNNRRYTMSDIGSLEKRIDKLEELTTLNMLELETSLVDVFDSNGNNRLKIGLTADNFKDHSQSARAAYEYNAAIDMFAGELRPPHISRNIELLYDSANSIDTILIGDTVYPTFTEVVEVSNTEATSGPSGAADTGAEPINAFNLGVVTGKIKMSPSSDVWFDEARLPAKVIDGGFDLDQSKDALWGSWGFNWSGVKENQLNAGYSETKTSTSTAGNIKTTTTATSTAGSSSIVTTSVKDEKLYETSIQYQRNKFVFFKASGLRPNTRYFPFYDNVSVANWVQTGVGKFAFFGSLTKDSPYLDAGNIYSNATQFPQSLGGPTAEIYSNANGEIEGIFLIPSTNTLKFLTGDTKFYLVDISVLNLADATSYTYGVFTTRGTLRHYQETVKSTRKYNIDVAITTKTETIPTVTTGGGGGGTTGGGGGGRDEPDRPGGAGRDDRGSGQSLGGTRNVAVGIGDTNRDRQGVDGRRDGISVSGGIGDTNRDRQGVDGRRSGGGTGCFTADTLIEMADGTTKRISNIFLGDMTRGGMVTAIHLYDGAPLYDYMGVRVSGTHYVIEDGKTIMVEESKLATKIDNVYGLYTIDTTDRRIFANGIEFADHNGDGVIVNFFKNNPEFIYTTDDALIEEIKDQVGKSLL